MFPKLKVVYFEGAGRAEAVRLVLHIGGVPFVDERISYEWFGRNKVSLPYGQLPVLDVDGHVLAQAQAILRYAGRLAGLYPTNDPVAALKVDDLLDVLDEVQYAMSPSFSERDTNKQKAMRIELAETTLPRYLSLLEARLATHAQYATLQTRDTVLVHEVALFVLVQALRSGYIEHIPTTVADGYPLLDQAVNKVAGHAKVVEWFGIQQHKAPKLKLTYVDNALVNASEPIRVALHIGGIAFDDDCITQDELMQRQLALPFEQVPMLRVNDDEISQSLAILRYVGSRSGLYPSTDALEAFQIDELLCAIDELRGNIRSSYDDKTDADKQNAMHHVLATETIPKVLSQLEQRVAANPSDGRLFAVGASLTVADLAIASTLDTLTSGRLTGVPTTVIDAFPKLREIREQVQTHPKVVEWNAARAHE